MFAVASCAVVFPSRFHSVHRYASAFRTASAHLSAAAGDGTSFLDKEPEAWNLESSWSEQLADELAAPYFAELREFVQRERSATASGGPSIFPPAKQQFAAFDACGFFNVRVVLLGQDPYHNGVAHGLSFSVAPGAPPPPSLKTIYKELERDLGLVAPQHGCLQSWAEQGVLMLNTVLTVRQGEANSHKNKGWEKFTSAAISTLSRERQDVVFLLWGNAAQNQARHIDRTKHLVLEAGHPSPLNRRRSFVGCSHFSQVNEYLGKHGHELIEWQLPRQPPPLRPQQPQPLRPETQPQTATLPKLTPQPQLQPQPKPQPKLQPQPQPKLQSQAQPPLPQPAALGGRPTPPRKTNYYDKGAGTPLSKGCHPPPQGDPECLAGLRFVISATQRSLDKEEMEELIKAHGGKVTSAMSGATSYLINGCRPGTDIPFTGVKLDHARAKEIPVIDEAALYKLIISKSDGSATVFPALAPTAAPAATAFFAGADLAARDRNLADLSQELEPEKLPVSEIRKIIENREALNDAEGEKGVGPDWVAEYDEKGVEPDWVAEEYEMWRAEQAAAAQMPLREPPPAAELAELAESDARDELGDAETNHVFPSGAVFPGRQALPEGTEDTNPHSSSPSSIRTDLKSE